MSQWQPTLYNSQVLLRPLHVLDYSPLFAAASDPLVWEQHPEPLRYTAEVFKKYFDGALESKGALLVIDPSTGEAIGCSRYYEYDEVGCSVAIGFTFLIRSRWGGEFNKAMKSLMLEYAFDFVRTVFFHVGVENRRSQLALEKIGAVRNIISATDEPLFQQNHPDHFVYSISREDWGDEGDKLF